MDLHKGIARARALVACGFFLICGSLGSAVAQAASLSPAAAQDDEARIEQLINRSLSPPKASSKATNRHSPKAEATSALIGQQVRVETVDHGLYLGSLQAAGADSIVLDIALPAQNLNYTLPRSAVVVVQPVGGGVQ